MSAINNKGPINNLACRDIRIESQTNSYYPAAERPETPPHPSIVIPFARDADFVKRGTLLDEVSERCAAPGSRTALVGLGGVGKSQLAIEHAYRTFERMPEMWVFWVYASNAARFEQSFRDIADSAKLDGRQEPRTNIFKLVHDWLRGCRHRWLLVLDNVDDARFLLDHPAANPAAASRPLREYLPRCARGSILITTRNREAALKLVERRDTVTVGPMDEPSALALFEKKLEIQCDSREVVELAAALEYMPLAIVQAAAYISESAPRCSVATYLDEYKKSECKQTSLLNYDKDQLRRDWEAKNSIIVTWQISFEYLQKTRQSAADLLSLMSFFDRQGIPEDLLRTRDKQKAINSSRPRLGSGTADNDEDDDASQSSASDPGSVEDTFEADVVTLRNFSFISDEKSGTTFEMHALVQLAMRRWLKANGQLERWMQHFIRNLYVAFPTGNYDNWASCQALFAHAKSAAGHQPEAESSRAEWATVLYRAAWYAWTKGSIFDAEELSLKSLKTRKKVLGREHEDTLRGISIVASVYKLGGRWEEAEKLEVQVVDISKTKLGADHPDTLTSMANLASTFWNQGRWEEAEKLDVQVVEISKTKLGADHPDTLTSMRNLAFTWKSLGHSGEAIALLQQCAQQH
ncbi:uncharacterized protein CC84DRAFT_459150 [Paraphaeosphaeria sporulosa]|uniref:Uncharacterized protein n=1 Tax=Paraphaeosphaeria sporulosa TaxID=1460663 RepID=A0A177CRS9_9PLEO|nr:uncharacterized protein CC84DRAFT_459150 [Paraphaeosphaeria sporulosa]OAG09996.1 hypothetical protein CC84DRAFT_459150 [Paraphaeosphaeria sporulosa]